MRFQTWGLTGTLATEHDDDLDFATERLWHWIGAIDDACNRFRPDSEVSALNRHPGEPLAVSPTLELALGAALRSAAMTGGLCDPTVLSALLALGYDRDYDTLAARGDVAVAAPTPAPGVGAIAWDRGAHKVTLAPDCAIDLGASAKALAADLVAAELVGRGGVVVEIGGDVAVRGRGPDGPWAIGVGESLTVTGHEPRVSHQGGVATSSTTARTWVAGGRVVNHVVDPRPGRCASGPYATATVAAGDCVTANAFATAALLWGEDAVYHVAQAGLSARLVRHDGAVEFVGGWPDEAAGP
ncbi:MAG: FAD:protein FMN transferase [Acidimicrobiales bacterium]